jgi:glycosyltransferase involved in cell wall biosynthesis
MPTSPLRIAHVIPQIGIGGTELQLSRLIALTPRDRAVHAVLYYSDSRDQDGFRIYRDAGIDLERVRRGRFDAPAFAGRLSAAIRQRRPDVLHCWLESAMIWGRWSGFVAGAPRIVLSIRNTEINLGPWLRLSHVLGGRGVSYLVNSRAVAASLAAHVGVRESSIAVIPNGIEVGPVLNALSRDTLLEENGCPPDTRIVLTVGRLTAIKNYPMLLRIAARCRGRLPVHFFIAGHGEDEAALRALAARLGVADTVHFLGLRRDVPALLGAADVFCYMTRYEGFPNALLEALAAGRPIVTSRFEGWDEVVVDGRTALVVDQDDDEAAFAALSRLVTDPGLSGQLGAAAKHDAETRFGMRRMVEATLAYYDSLMAERP